MIRRKSWPKWERALGFALLASASSLAMSNRALASVGASCASSPGSVDQSQLLSNGDIGVDASQTVTQSIVVGKTGVLTGVEVGTDACNGVDPQAMMQLTVLSNGTSIGGASLSANSIPVGACGSNPLSANSVGPGLFDLSTQCIQVIAGQTLVLQLTVTSPSTPACGPNGLCTGGDVGKGCSSVQQCAYNARVGVLASPVTTNPYPQGEVTANGQPQAPSVWALSFKTFVADGSTSVPAIPRGFALLLSVLLGTVGVLAIRRPGALR